MRIGLISDVHGRLSDAATSALSGCDRILCAGDCETPDVVYGLEAVAPVTAVLGNCDVTPALTSTLDPVASPLLGGVRFYMVHRPQDVPAHLSADVDVVVHGHTHVPRLERVDGRLWINPGSPTRPRGGSMPTVAVMDVAEGRVGDVVFVTLGD